MVLLCVAAVFFIFGLLVSQPFVNFQFRFLQLVDVSGRVTCRPALSRVGKAFACF